MENASSINRTYVGARVGGVESSASAVSWAAVIAGAVIAAALWLMLLSAGAGLGFVSMSPWAGEGASAMTLGVGAVIWMIATHIIAYGVGGYVAGRLRTIWVDVHSDEVYFRDTAHGFLVWALSALISAVIVGSLLSSAATGAAQVGASAASSVGSAVAGSVDGEAVMPTEYFADTLLRSEQPDPAGDPAAARAEVARIVGVSLMQGEMTQPDRTYVARVMSAQAGIDQAAAEARVDETIENARRAAEEAETTAREAADVARKAAAGFALWAFASLLIGAFVASWMATVGGRRRDQPDY